MVAQTVERELAPTLSLHVMPGLADDLLPRYDHRQRFSVEIAAAPDVVWSALHETRFSDLRILRVLMAVRTLGCSEHAGDDAPILTGARLAPHVLVEEVPGREVAIALMGRFWTMNAFETISERAAFTAGVEPDFVRTTSTMTVEETARGTRLTIENRVQDPRDPLAARKFCPYWYFMGKIGAAIFAVDLLEAAKRRAETRVGAERPRARIHKGKIASFLFVAASVVALALVGFRRARVCSCGDRVGDMAHEPRCKHGAAPR